MAADPQVVISFRLSANVVQEVRRIVEASAVPSAIRPTLSNGAAIRAAVDAFILAARASAPATTPAAPIARQRSRPLPVPSQPIARGAAAAG